MLIFVLVSFAFFAFFTYIVKSVYFWRRYGKCNPKFQLICTNTINTLFSRNNMANRIELIYRAYPKHKFIGYYELLRPILLIKDPELIEEIFVKNFHCFHDRLSKLVPLNRINQHVAFLSSIKWRQVRSKLVPTFSPMKLKMMCDSLYKCTQVLNSRIRYLIL